jgi:hypothetical protein
MTSQQRAEAAEQAKNKIQQGSQAGKFQSLPEDEICLGQVGAVAAREVSRFARNSREWQRLVEVCRVVDTLLIDQETVYTPRQSNDRLLLGLNRPDTQNTSYSTSGRIDASGLPFDFDTECGLRLVKPSRLQI